MTLASKRVSPKTIEETYTDSDVPKNVTNEYGIREYTSYDQSIGFQFDYPMRWLNDKSDFKAVGIRRLKVVPTSHTFSFTFNIMLSWFEATVEAHNAGTEEAPNIDYYTINYTVCDMVRAPKALNIPIKVHIDQKILHSNYTHEILTSMVNQINDTIHNDQVDALRYTVQCQVPANEYNTSNHILTYLSNTYYVSKSGTFTYAQPCTVPASICFTYTYDCSSGLMTLYPSYTGGDNLHDIIREQCMLQLPRQTSVVSLTPLQVDACCFCIHNPSQTLNNTNLVSFLMLINQPINDESLTYITQPAVHWSFNDVWDREVLQVHASFSDNNRGFIGLNGDFYEKPSVLYEPPTNASNFSIFFTTDGHHRILLRYCRFFIGLCFIRNYNTSLATK